MARLTIIWHSRTGTSRALAKAAARGAGEGARLIEAALATPSDLLEAAGYLFVCPENLGTMSGTMKELFDRSYYPLLGQVEGRPYATMIAAGSDGTGAQAQIDRIATGWRLRRVAPPMIVCVEAQTPEAILAEKLICDQVIKQAEDLGAAFAAGIELGIF